MLILLGGGVMLSGCGETAVSDNQMVEDFDVQQLACFDQLSGHGDVLGGGRIIARGVVVCHNDGRCRSFDGRAEHLVDTHHTGIETAPVDCLCRQYPITGIAINYM